MKRFIQLFFVILIVNISASFVYADDYPLFWLEKTLPTQPIIEFSKLSEAEMVETLRTQYHVHVLIYPDPDGPLNQKLTLNNTKEDEQYLEALGKELENEKTEGAYCSPYFSIFYKDKQFIPRPLWQEPLILIREFMPYYYEKGGALKFTLLHEFLHHCLYLLRNDVPQEKEGIKYSPRIDKLIRVNELEKQLEAFERKDSKEALLLSGKIKILKLESLKAFEGEEMDVYRFVYDNRDEVGLSLPEILRTWHDVIRYNGKMYKKTSSIENELQEEKKLSKDPELISLWNDIGDQLNHIRRKSSAIGHWYDEQGILIMEHPELFPAK